MVQKTPLEIFAFLDGDVPSLSTKEGIKITPGKTKKSDLAKKLRAKFGGALDDWMLALPSGGDLK